MLYKYEIRNNGIEDILYLYLDFKNEFSKELANNTNQQDLTRRTRNFIMNNNIQFKGSKVYLIIDGIVVKSIDLNDTNHTAKNNPNYSNNHFLIHLKMEDKSIIEISLKDYLLGTMASTYNTTNLEEETLKCIAILYRTYAYKMMEQEKLIDNSNSFLRYKHISMFKMTWLSNYQRIVDKLLKAIDETDCMFLTWNNNYILPFIHVCNNGKTFSNTKYPYLASVPSLWDLTYTNSREVIEYSYQEISNLLNIPISYRSKIEITKINKDHSILNLKINDKTFTGEEFKNRLSLKSLNFNIILYHQSIKIINFGCGNGLGLSLYGSNELSKDGVDYPNILKYYFPKTNLNKYIKELL